MSDEQERLADPISLYSPSASATPSSPGSVHADGNRPAFLAAYGLELEGDEDDEGEEEGEGKPKQGKERKKTGLPSRGLLKRTFSPPRRESSGSPTVNAVAKHGRRTSLVDLVKTRSPTGGNSSESSHASRSNLTYPATATAPRGEGASSNESGPFHSPISRRGFANAYDDQDESSSSPSPQPTPAAMVDLQASSVTPTMDSLVSPDLSPTHTHSDLAQKMDDTASSIYDGDSWESGSGKASGIAPPPLPQRPIATDLPIQQSSPVVPPSLPPRRRSVPLPPATSEEGQGEKTAKGKKESKRKREARERKILMKSYEELEVERFLTDFGKNVHKVRSIGFVESALATHSWPRREDWRHRETGQTNIAGFAFAYVLSLLTYLSPSRFMDLQAGGSTAEDLQEMHQEEQFRLAALRANAERLYMTALPIYEGLFDRMRRIWRWESKIKTACCTVVYFTFWFRGMLLPALFGLMIFNVLRVGSYPPKPEVLREMLQRQQRSTRELQQVKESKAEDVIRQAQQEPEPTDKVVKKASRYGLAADATRRYGKAATMLTSALADVHERIKNFVMWRSPPATWRALTLLLLAMIISLFSTPWMMARLPGLAVGLCFFFLAPIVEFHPDWLGVEWTNPFDFLLAGVPNDAQYAMTVLRKRAAMGEALIGDKEVARWMSDEEEEEEEEEQEEAAGKAAESSTAVKAAEAPSSATSSSVDWKKWKARAVKGREMAVAGSEMLSGQRPVQLPRLNNDPDTARVDGDGGDGGDGKLGARMASGMAKGINWGLGSIQDTSNRKLIQRRLEPDEVMSASDGVYWAVYLGSCGHVVVNAERIRFRSLFARKMTTDSTSSQNVEEQDQVAIIDATTGQCQVNESQLESAKVRTLLDVRLESVTQLKKTRAVNVGVWGIDGLEVRSRGGKVHQFSSIVRRDEAFNRILALAPQNWSKM